MAGAVSKGFLEKERPKLGLKKKDRADSSIIIICYLPPPVGGISSCQQDPALPLGNTLPLIPGHMVGEGQTLIPSPSMFPSPADPIKGAG